MPGGSPSSNQSPRELHCRRFLTFPYLLHPLASSNSTTRRVNNPSSSSHKSKAFQCHSSATVHKDPLGPAPCFSYDGHVFSQRYPPTEVEKADYANSSGVPSLALAGPHGQQHSGRKRKPSIGAAHFPAEQIQRLHAAWQKAQQTHDMQAMAAARQALPIAPYRCASQSCAHPGHGHIANGRVPAVHVISCHHASWMEWRACILRVLLMMQE